MSTLDARIAAAQAVLDGLLKERKELREKEKQELIDLNPWKVGDRVTTKFSTQNGTVTYVSPKSVVVLYTWGEERIPLRRVLPEDPAKVVRTWGLW